MTQSLFSPQHVWVGVSNACGNSIFVRRRSQFLVLSYQWNCWETKIFSVFVCYWEKHFCSMGIASSWTCIMEAFISSVGRRKRNISIRQIQFMIVNKQKFVGFRAAASGSKRFAFAEQMYRVSGNRRGVEKYLIVQLSESLWVRFVPFL